MSEQAGLILPILATDNGTIAAVNSSLTALDTRLKNLTESARKAAADINKAEADAAKKDVEKGVTKDPEKNRWQRELEYLQKYTAELKNLKNLGDLKPLLGDITGAKVLKEQLEGPAIAMRKLALEAAKAASTMTLYNKENLEATRIQLNGIAAVKERAAAEAKLAAIRAS